jgi:hypothetical protein
MNKIPTAAEFLIKNKDSDFRLTKSGLNVSDMMIKFAKLHVEAAIKECIESAPSGSSTDTVSYKDVVNALKDCYPLTNIK